MSGLKEQTHEANIVDQLSRQAIPFIQVPGHFDAIQILIELSGVCPDDAVLDVACGPGMVACEFARHAGQVTGIDITLGGSSRRKFASNSRICKMLPGP